MQYISNIMLNIFINYSHKIKIKNNIYCLTKYIHKADKKKYKNLQ